MFVFVSQLLSITHEMYKSFNCDPLTDMRGTFLDISKTFDKFWHKSLMFKSKTCSTDGTPLTLLENYLSDRQQRAVLNDEICAWQNIYASVPQVSVLETLLFLIY